MKLWFIWQKSQMEEECDIYVWINPDLNPNNQFA